MIEPGRILIVDDSRPNRLTLLRGIEHLGHTGALAEDGQQALDMLRAQPFDIILLDILMPGLDGFQILECVKGDPALRDIPVIVISGVEEMESIARSIELGAEDFLAKPFNRVLLRARLNASLEKKHYRDLERAYLRQELMLRQSEKLVTLGRLSAGMAHELNNPVAAAQRGVGQLRTIVEDLQRAYLGLSQSALTEGDQALLVVLEERAEAQADQPVLLDPLASDELEQAIEAGLRARGVDRPWEYAASLVSLGLQLDELTALLDRFTPVQVPDLITWLSRTATFHSVLAEIGRGLQRITQVVAALKSYSNLDRAPVQLMNVNDGLESTLQVLSVSSHEELTVRRDYANDLPRIPAFASQLNQVWSNIIDNAVTAMNGAGELSLRTRREESWVRVEIEDTGPGIPEPIQSKIFDPFFTTKPPGQGMGLGLAVSHQIVVENHRGRISVESRPGMTRVVVLLPINPDVKD